MANDQQNIQIGNYQVINELSRGTFGRVYLAQHALLTNRTVAIKLLHATLLGSSEEHQSFLQEAQFLEQLKHPYILPIVDVGIDNGVPYLVSEYAPNGSLRERLRKHAPHLLPLQESLAILTQIGQALQFAHQKHVIHRDIKPENILFNAKNEALLADFGIATTLMTAASIKHVDKAGTPLYMAPEQFRNTVSKESDQYALACIAYEVMTGHQPFDASDIYALGFKHLLENPTPPTQLNPMLSPLTEQVILKAMAKDRVDRYPDMRAFIMALQASFTVQLPTITPSQVYTPVFPAASEPLASFMQGSPHQPVPPQHPGPITPVPLQQEPEPGYTGFAPPVTPSYGVAHAQSSAGLSLKQPHSIGQAPTAPVLPTSAPMDERGGAGSSPATVMSTVGLPVYPQVDHTIPLQAHKQHRTKRTWLLVALACIVVLGSGIGVLALVAPTMLPWHVTSANTPSPVSFTTATVRPEGSVTSVPTHTKLAAKPRVTTAPTDRKGTSTPVATATSASGLSGPPATKVPTGPPTPVPTPTPTPTQPPAPPEQLTVPFAYGNTGERTKQSYSGTITITVSGSGRANQTAMSDAFYQYTDTSGNPMKPPQTGSCYVLLINGSPAASFLSSVPSYNSGHTYTFSINAPGGLLTFAECDPDTTTDTGDYTITIQVG